MNQFGSVKKNSFENEWKRRITLLMGVVFIIAVFLGWRLYTKSIGEHEKYKELADSQHTVRQSADSHRGKIYAQDISSQENVELVTNVEKYSISVVPKNVKDKKDLANKLGQLIGMSETNIFEKINNDKLYIPPLIRRADKELADKVLELNLLGVIVALEDGRYYPEETLASNILGFVNFEGEGKYGLEGFYNDQLKGTSGIIEGLKDTHGKVISTDTTKEINNGSDLILTIDSNVQYIAEQKVKEAKEKYQADGASIIIVDPKTGAVIAMAANTSYDPNKFNEIANNEGPGIFNNKLISNTWEPGSIMKPIIMSAAIDSGKVQPDTEEVFTNMTTVQGYEIHTAEDKSFGKETMTNVLENSDNVAMVWVADKIGNEDMYKYLDKFNFGKKTGIDLEAEASGTLPELKKWRDINRATMSFGQGIAVTPLQVVMAYSAIVNGGKLMKPYVVDKIVRPDGKELKTENKTIDDQVISSETSQKLRDMLVSTATNGHTRKAGVEGYTIGAKTGTAQIPGDDGKYKENEYNHSLAGFFPAEDPKFVMLTRVDNPKSAKYAESTAAPLFSEMAKWILNYYKISKTN